MADAEPAEDTAATPATSHHVANTSATDTPLPPPPPPQQLNDDMGDAGQADPASRTSPEPTQTDLEGHYVGPSSGVAFLLRVQKRLEKSVSFPHSSSVFNFGDAPLPQYNSNASAISPMTGPQPYFDTTFSMMLSREYTVRLVQRYFDFAVPVDRFLHRPTIERWLAEFYDTMGAMHSRDDAPAQTAILFMVFAIAQEHLKPQLTAVESGMRYVNCLSADNMGKHAEGTISEQRPLLPRRRPSTLTRAWRRPARERTSTAVSMSMASPAVSN